MLVGSQRAKLTKIEEFKFNRKKKAKKSRTHPSYPILQAVKSKSPQRLKENMPRKTLLKQITTLY